MININIYYTTFQENAIKLEKILYTFLCSLFYWISIILDVKWRREKYRTNIRLGFMYDRIEGREWGLYGITKKINAAFMIIQGIIFL